METITKFFGRIKEFFARSQGGPKEEPKEMSEMSSFELFSLGKHRLLEMLSESDRWTAIDTRVFVRVFMAYMLHVEDLPDLMVIVCGNEFLGRIRRAAGIATLTLIEVRAWDYQCAVSVDPHKGRAAYLALVQVRCPELRKMAQGIAKKTLYPYELAAYHEFVGE